MSNTGWHGLFYDWQICMGAMGPRNVKIGPYRARNQLCWVLHLEPNAQKWTLAELSSTEEAKFRQLVSFLKL